MSDTTKDPIKEAFAKAKQDIFNLSSQIELLKREIHSLKETLKPLLKNPTDQQTDNPTHNPAQNSQNQTFQHVNPAHNASPTDNPAHNLLLKTLKSQISNISTRNQGVPADRQTDRQTDSKHPNTELNEPLDQNNPAKIQHINQQTTHQHLQHTQDIQTKAVDKPIERVSQILESLDSIKKDIRIKFKRLTQQEMLVFSTIYQLEEEGSVVDYPLISQKLSLTESSIRDYIQRILKKGIPLIKTKENNKKVLLSISPDIKKLATLSTIIQLREL